ncbi:MAG: AAA family ATPase [Melioribacteraceae bacterium]
MDIIVQDQLNLTNLSKINVLIGKNGCGKSTLLKLIEKYFNGEEVDKKNYVTPERGGALKYNSSVEQNDTLENWTKNQKNKNQWDSFKNYSITQYRRLEILSLREIEKSPVLRQNLEFTFDTIIDKINDLLSNIKIARTSRGDFEIFLKNSTEKLEPEHISSGESELISLAIECLTFEKSCEATKQNVLLLDEPDVHLHPDLQANFVNFLIDLVKTDKFIVLIATHSTAILGALVNYENARFSILANGSKTASFKPLTQIYQSILPIFGAHPLSNLFNQQPILLVEGEDDVRIWQQAIRSSNGAMKFYPCSVGGNGNMPDYESAVIDIITGVYDNAKAYSLIDRDGTDENQEDTLPIVRFKLSCRAAENLILADEVLQSLNTSWVSLQAEIEKWLNSFTGHQKFEIMNNFKNNQYVRKDFDLKEIRNILIGLTGTSKPWEVAVGQVIGNLAIGNVPLDFSDNKISNYLGRKLANQLSA